MKKNFLVYVLILTIISTAVAVASFIVSLIVKNDVKEIKNYNVNKTNNIQTNSGIVADSIKGEVTLNGKQW